MANQTNTFKIAVRKFKPFENAMQLFWAQFCQQTGCRLKLEMVVMDLHDLYKNTITNNGLANGDFDIAHINTDWIYEGYTKNAFEVLNPYIKQNPPQNYPKGWSKTLLGLQEFNGNIVGLPFHDGPECFIYRKDLFADEIERANYFAAYGQELTVPKTWNDFVQIARFFHRPAQNLYGSIFAGYADGHNTVFDFCLQLWTHGGNLLDEKGKIDLDSTAAQEALSFYRAVLNDEEVVHPKSKNVDSVGAGMAFAKGEVAMMVNWFGFASFCEVEESSKVKGMVEIDMLPTTQGNTSASLNVYWLYTLAKGSKNKDMAYQFLQFITNAKNDKQLTLSGGIGCRLSTWHDEEINNIIPYYHKLTQLHEVAKMLPQTNNWAQIASIIDEMVLSALNTPQSIEEIVKKAQAKINQIKNEPIH